MRNEEASTREWLKRAVIALNLCPFANKELQANTIRFALTSATNEEHLLELLCDELSILDASNEIETSLIIYTTALADFYDFNDFAARAQSYLSEHGRDGVYQLASFHPHYQFAGTNPNDAENYTNRSPYPMLHILREESVRKAIEVHPDTLRIPERNIEKMNQLGVTEMASLVADCKKLTS